MKTGPAHVAALRALPSGDDEALERLAPAAGSEDETIFGLLVSMTFLSAARARFAAGWTTAEVIRFVAQVRAQNGYDDLVPSLAEALLINALGGEKAYRVPGDDVNAYTQMALLETLATGLSEPELDCLVEEARRQAEHWLPTS
jgi:hypothetical protein